LANSRDDVTIDNILSHPVGPIPVSMTWFTIAWTCSSSRFKAICFISSCEVLLVLAIPALSFIALLNDVRKCPAFEKGEFSIRQTSGSFNGIWSDMGTDKTIIKDSKGSGGIAFFKS
jgi:hypothetical protein